MDDTACGLLPRHRKHIPERVFERRREIEALPPLYGTGCKPTVCIKKSLNKHFLFISQSKSLARADGRTRWTQLWGKVSTTTACRNHFVCVDMSGWNAHVLQETTPVTLEVLLPPPYGAEWKRTVFIYCPRGPINLPPLPQHEDHFLLGNTSSSEGSQWALKSLRLSATAMRLQCLCIRKK